MLKRFSRRWSVVVCIPTLERWERGTRKINTILVRELAKVLINNPCRYFRIENLIIINKSMSYIKSVYCLLFKNMTEIKSCTKGYGKDRQWQHLYKFLG